VSENHFHLVYSIELKFREWAGLSSVIAYLTSSTEMRLKMFVIYLRKITPAQDFVDEQKEEIREVKNAQM